MFETGRKSYFKKSRKCFLFFYKCTRFSRKEGQSEHTGRFSEETGEKEALEEADRLKHKLCNIYGTIENAIRGTFNSIIISQNFIHFCLKND